MLEHLPPLDGTVPSGAFIVKDLSTMGLMKTVLGLKASGNMVMHLLGIISTSCNWLASVQAPVHGVPVSCTMCADKLWDLKRCHNCHIFQTTSSYVCWSQVWHLESSAPSAHQPKRIQVEFMASSLNKMDNIYYIYNIILYYIILYYIIFFLLLYNI